MISCAAQGNHKICFIDPLNAASLSVRKSLGMEPRIASASVILVPLAIGKHWYLVVIDLERERLFHFDSFGTRDVETKTMLLDRTANIVRTLMDDQQSMPVLDKLSFVLNQQSMDMEGGDCLVQADNFQCGVWLCFFDQVITSWRPPLHDDDNDWGADDVLKLHRQVLGDQLPPVVAGASSLKSLGADALSKLVQRYRDIMTDALTVVIEEAEAAVEEERLKNAKSKEGKQAGTAVAKELLEACRARLSGVQERGNQLADIQAIIEEFEDDEAAMDLLAEYIQQI